MGEEEKFNLVTCCNCGVEFRFSKELESRWRESEKLFYCPNGHGQLWSKPKETAEQKELKKLRAEVTDLQAKLDVALKEAADQKKRADELANELEIWRPSTKEPETPVG